MVGKIELFGEVGSGLACRNDIAFVEIGVEEPERVSMDKKFAPS